MARNSKPRKLEEEDYIGFFQEADKRPTQVTADTLVELLRKKNSFRWWRLQYDVKWARKQLKKRGYDPNLIRELL